MQKINAGLLLICNASLTEPSQCAVAKWLFNKGSGVEGVLVTEVKHQRSVEIIIALSGKLLKDKSPNDDINRCVWTRRTSL